MNSFLAQCRQHSKLILLALAAVAVLWLIWSFGRVLVPFLLGLLIAWLLQPVISWIEVRVPALGRHQRARHITVVVGIYLIAAFLIAVAVFYIISFLGRSLLSLVEEAPELIPTGIAAIEERIQTLLAVLPPVAQEQAATFISQMEERAGGAFVEFVYGGIGRVGGLSDMLLGFVSLPVFLFYLLKDWNKLRDSIDRALPCGAATHVRNVSGIMRNVIGRYIRAQLLLAVIGGVLVYIMLSAAGIQYAVPLAIFAAIAELAPIIGPWLLSILGILVILATDPHMVIWMALGYVLIRILSNNVFEPVVQGHHMRLHPALVIVITIVAASVAGLIGLVIALPVTMTVVEIVKYVRVQARSAPAVDESGPA